MGKHGLSVIFTNHSGARRYTKPMLTNRHIFSALLAAVLSFAAVDADARSKKSHAHTNAHSSSLHVKAKTAARKRISVGPIADIKRSQDSYAHIWKDAQRSISPAEAKSIARKRVPGGQVVDIKRRGDTYSVRVIKKSGKVVDVLIDANTGRVK